jgi:two-component system response regulator AtoC
MEADPSPPVQIVVRATEPIRQAEKAWADRAKRGSVPMADRFRVLVIDDDPGVRDYMEALVARQGYDVSAAADGEEALRNLDTSQPDLITLDVVLPGMDGLQTLEKLKQRLPDVPVVMLSGHGQARNIVEAMRRGASDFLRKPFEVEELELAFQKALEKRALKQEVERLRGRARSETDLMLLTGDNPKMREIRDIVEQVADTDITVLIRGESGTGKEVVARTLFQLSGRRDQPFVKVNCAALPSELLESELFGFEKGAFTGAHKRKLGKFEYANHGTIFLDEISEMHPSLQAKLLQVLQDGEFSRLGSESDVNVDTRIIAATNRNLEDAVADGSFREDLYYRLNVVTVQLPPLRDRKDAIPLLVDQFLQKNNEQYRKEVTHLSPETMEIFTKYHWPGNVRELENLVRRMVVLGNEGAVVEEIRLTGSRQQEREEASDSPDLGSLGADFSSEQGIDLKAISRRAAQLAEKGVIEKVLQETRWNRKEAAERLQISYKALLYKMKENGLSQNR